jgi:hypothetical protein
MNAKPLPADARRRQRVIDKLARTTLPAPSDEALVATFLRDSAELVAGSQGRHVVTEARGDGFYIGFPALNVGFMVTVERAR